MNHAYLGFEPDRNLGARLAVAQEAAGSFCPTTKVWLPLWTTYSGDELTVTLEIAAGHGAIGANRGRTVSNIDSDCISHFCPAQIGTVKVSVSEISETEVHFLHVGALKLTASEECPI